MRNRINVPGLIDRIVYRGILVLLVLAPLPFGSVHVWAYSFLQAGVFFLLFVFAVNRLAVFGLSEFTWVKTPVNFFLILFFIVLLFQMVPLPPKLISHISPITYADKSRAFSLLAETSVPGFFPLAYYRHPVIIELIKALSYLGFFFLVINTVKTRKQIHTLIFVLILMGIFEAVYGLFQAFSDTPRVLWWESRVGKGGFASGTFIVSNHFAFYLEMIFGATLGLLVAQKSGGRRFVSGLGGSRAFSSKVLEWFSPESARPKRLFLFLGIILMGVAILYSASRGGIISLGVSLLFIAFLFLIKNRFRKLGVLVLAVCLSTLVYGVYLGMEPTLKKFSRSEKGLELRLSTTESMVPMIWDYPALGVGWGNFRYLYPRYVPEDYDGVSSSGYSHNDWLECATEAGITGFILIAGAFLAFCYRLIRVWKRRRDPYAVGIGAGVLVALVSTAIHSFFDFSMRIPANPMTLAALAGVGFAAVHCRGYGYSQSFFYKTGSIRLTGARRAVLFAGACFILFSMAYYAGRHFLAEAKCPTEWNSTMNLDWTPPPEKIRAAIDINPQNAEYYYRLAEYYIHDRVDEVNITEEEIKRKSNEKAIEALERAVKLNPARGRYWYSLGVEYLKKTYEPYDFFPKWVPPAEKFFDMAVYCAPADATILFNVAQYWVWRSSILAEAKPEGEGLSKKDAVEKFQGLFQRALKLKPSRWKAAAERVRRFYKDDAVLVGIAPDPELGGRILRWAHGGK